jgi:hypothetical protein
MGLILVSTRRILASFPLGMGLSLGSRYCLPVHHLHPCRTGHEVAAQFEGFDRSDHGAAAGHGANDVPEQGVPCRLPLSRCAPGCHLAPLVDHSCRAGHEVAARFEGFDSDRGAPAIGVVAVRDWYIPMTVPQDRNRRRLCLTCQPIWSIVGQIATNLAARRPLPVTAESARNETCQSGRILSLAFPDHHYAPADRA